MASRLLVVVIALVAVAACGGSDGSSPTMPTTVTTAVAAPVTVKSLAVTASTTTLKIGETVTMTATATYSNGTTDAVAATWTSSNTSVATVATSGTVTTLAVGSTTVTATAGGQTGTSVITVLESTVTVTSLTVTGSTATPKLGETVTMTATATYSDGTTVAINPTWTSSDTSVATVATSGTVTTLAVGSTTVTATAGGQTGTSVITVLESTVTVTSLAVTGSTTTPKLGETVTMTATATYGDGTTAAISPTWTSSDTSVATVATSGTVTTLAIGTSTITATVAGQAGSMTLTVIAPLPTTWRGLIIAEENRCSPYDSDEYNYSQSVEDDIITRLGGIYSPYTGECFDSKSETDIEHIVARSEAHDSGLCAVDATTRSQFSSDLDNLTLASPTLNRYQKGAKDAADWLPVNNRCWFATTIIEVRRKYGLTIDQREANVLDQILATCASTVLEQSTCSGGTQVQTESGIVINEFRTRGPQGASDEFVELRNTSQATINVGGWQFVGSNSSGGTSVRRNIPSGVVIEAGCYYLLGNSNTNGYTGLTDTTYSVGITDTGGLALRNSAGTVLDQVGLSTGSAFKEGSPLSSFPSSNTNQSFARSNGDTNDNASDFTLTSPSTPKTSASACVP